jgi:uncharacterized protein (DUF1501 family)
LNTFIPYSDELYYSKRPSIAIPEKSCLKINDTIGLHPKLQEFAKLYNEMDLAIFNNVGYPNPNLSHFTSLINVEKAISGDNGWAYEAIKNSSRDLDGIVFSGSTGLFNGDVPNFVKINKIKNFIKQSRRIRISTGSRSPQVVRLNQTKALIKNTGQQLGNAMVGIKSYNPSKDSRLSRDFAQIATIIKSNINIPVLKLQLSGFDTHADQSNRQGELLKELDSAVKEFSRYLKSQGLWNNTLLYSFSEFGRRIAENGNGGTDHGEAYTGFAMGGRVIGGVYGSAPNLNDKNIEYGIDFRQLLHTLENDWIGGRHVSKSVGEFKKIGFIKNS